MYPHTNTHTHIQNRLLYDFLVSRSDMRGAARAMVAYARRLRADGASDHATVAEALSAYGVCFVVAVRIWCVFFSVRIWCVFCFCCQLMVRSLLLLSGYGACILFLSVAKVLSGYGA
jgi:hypothetical protein